MPSILLGLYNAPKLVNINDTQYADIKLNSIKALIMPHNCLGGIAVLKAIEKDIPVLAVEDNKTVLNINAKALNIEDKVIKVKNYTEAAEYLVSLKA